MILFKNSITLFYLMILIFTYVNEHIMLCVPLGLCGDSAT